MLEEFWALVERAPEDDAAREAVIARFGRRAVALVADIAGFQHIARHRGVVGALAVTRAVDRAAAPVLDAAGAVVRKLSGDSLLAVLPDEERALLAALDLAAAVARLDGPTGNVGLSVGLAAGPLLAVAGADAWGHPVNDAFRLAGAADRGEVLVTPPLLEAVALPPGVGAWRAPADREQAAGLPFVVVRDYRD